MTDNFPHLVTAQEALATYDKNESDYRSIPEEEQTDRDYENYEDGILDNVHTLAECLREVLALLDPPTPSSMLDDSPSPEGTETP